MLDKRIAYFPMVRRRNINNRLSGLGPRPPFRNLFAFSSEPFGQQPTAKSRYPWASRLITESPLLSSNRLGPVGGLASCFLCVITMAAVDGTASLDMEQPWTNMRIGLGPVDSGGGL